MQGESSNERWQELVDLREEFEHGDAVLPTRISAIDGRRLEASPEAVINTFSTSNAKSQVNISQLD
jgi:hypothetical protein